MFLKADKENFLLPPFSIFSAFPYLTRVNFFFQFAHRKHIYACICIYRYVDILKNSLAGGIVIHTSAFFMSYL